MTKYSTFFAARRSPVTQLIPLNEVAQDRSMHCEPLIPNAETVRAMRSARQGKSSKHKTIADLMADLHV
ncbi:MAG: hypothetical protein NT032_08125 [Actinobacteria bacterium]|nr:hypothetical protein [Actinomycetota bacterium]